MLLSFTRLSTPLPSNLSSIRKENLDLKFLKNSSLLLPTITPRPLFKLFCRHTSFNDTAAGTSRSESEFENVDSYEVESGQSSEGIGSPNLFRPLVMPRMNLGDQAFFLLAFIACTTSVAFTSLVIAAVPTLFALKRAAISLAKLADTAREELPSTMAAIRLSGLEISDLTLEINELSGEIADGVNKSAQAVQLAEARIRQFGALARQRTISMIQERANLPEIPIRPIVARAARSTSDAVSRAAKKISNLFSCSDAVSKAEPKACENKSGPLNEETEA